MFSYANTLHTFLPKPVIYVYLLYSLFLIIMDQKTIILLVLAKLKPYRDMADWLIAFVESEYVTNESLATISRFLQEKIKNSKEALHTGKLKSELSTIKNEELVERKVELDELQMLLDSIN